jgi:hypothetical protein
MKEKLLGPDHPDIAITLNNLAVLLKSQGQPEGSATLPARAHHLRAGVGDGSSKSHHVS